MTKPHDQIRVMMNTAVGANLVPNFGTEVGALMDSSVGGACSVSWHCQQWEFVDDNMPLPAVVAEVHTRQLAKFLVGCEQNEDAVEHKLLEEVLHTFDSKLLPFVDLQDTPEQGSATMETSALTNTLDSGAETLLIGNVVPAPQHYDTENADSVLDTAYVASIFAVRDTEVYVAGQAAVAATEQVFDYDIHVHQQYLPWFSSSRESFAMSEYI